MGAVGEQFLLLHHHLQSDHPYLPLHFPDRHSIDQCVPASSSSSYQKMWSQDPLKLTSFQFSQPSYQQDHLRHLQL
nr:hypothetical protein Iba_chr12bCG23060 [Ipomoea batatas]